MPVRAMMKIPAKPVAPLETDKAANARSALIEWVMRLGYVATVVAVRPKAGLMPAASVSKAAWAGLA